MTEEKTFDIIEKNYSFFNYIKGKLYMDFQNIGKRIKQLRKRYNITLSDISSKTGISLSSLSLIENGKLIPTLRNLDEIATFFGVHISYFFEEEKKQDIFVLFKRGDHVELESKNFKSKLTFLLPKINMCVHPVLLEIEKGGKSGPPTKHKGWDFAYIIQGKGRIYVGESSVEVEEGDSLLIDSSYLHYGENIGEEKLISIWIGIEEKGGGEDEKDNK